MHENTTVVAFFILKGISDVPGLQFLIFHLVFFIYLLTLISDMAILLLVGLDPQLHTPMYFFLCNLSVLDISSTTVTLHKTLIIFTTGCNKVSFTDCMVQLYIFSWLSSNELLLLTAMSYDRYVAICNPLHYSTVMSGRVYAGLATFCWSLSFLQVLPSMIIVSQFTCYTTNIINHFFCDIMPLIHISCSDTSTLNLLIFTEGALLEVLTPFLLTFISYVFIISTIMKIKTSTGRSKAFYTCSSHLTVVVLHYAVLVCQYFTPSGTISFAKILSLCNTALVPMLNPFIYSLKNKDVKAALQRQLKHITTVYHPAAF